MTLHTAQFRPSKLHVIPGAKQFFLSFHGDGYSDLVRNGNSKGAHQCDAGPYLSFKTEADARIIAMESEVVFIEWQERRVDRARHERL